MTNLTRRCSEPRYIQYRVGGEIPPEEIWQFKPGEIVRARYEKKSPGDTVLVAYESAAI